MIMSRFFIFLRREGSNSKRNLNVYHAIYSCFFSFHQNSFSVRLSVCLSNCWNGRITNCLAKDTFKAFKKGDEGSFVCLWKKRDEFVFYLSFFLSFVSFPSIFSIFFSLSIFFLSFFYLFLSFFLSFLSFFLSFLLNF